MLHELSRYKVSRLQTTKLQAIADEQQTNEKLKGLKNRLLDQYIEKNLGNSVRDIICYVKEHDDPQTQWKIQLDR